MAAALRFAQQEFCAAANHLHAVPQEFLHHLLERQSPRPAIYECQENDADRALQRRKLVELIQYQSGISIALQVYDEADRLTIAGARFIADRGNPLDALVANQFADLFVEAVARLLEWHFRD